MAKEIRTPQTPTPPPPPPSPTPPPALRHSFALRHSHSFIALPSRSDMSLTKPSYLFSISRPTSPLAPQRRTPAPASSDKARPGFFAGFPNPAWLENKADNSQSIPHNVS